MSYVLGKMIFIHIPKCGGHTVLEEMKRHGGFRMKDRWEGGAWSCHPTASALKERMGAEWDSYEKVTVVREPRERAVGLFELKMKGQALDLFHFSRYMHKMKGRSSFRFNPWTVQSRFLLPEVKVFRLDQIERLWEFMEEMHGIEIGKVQAVNSYLKPVVARRWDWRKLYSQEMWQMMTARHRGVLEQFGWE